MYLSFLASAFTSTLTLSEAIYFADLGSPNTDAYSQLAEQLAASLESLFNQVPGEQHVMITGFK